MRLELKLFITLGLYDVPKVGILVNIPSARAHVSNENL
jgi:hypothetical protein